MRLLLLLFFAISFIFGFDTFTQVEIFDQNISLKKSGYIVTKENLSPIQAYQYFKNNETLKFPDKVYKLNNDYTADTWLFYEVNKNKSENPFLDIKDPYADYCTLYSFKNEKLLNTQISGNAILIEKRTIKEFPVRFKLQDADIYIIHIKAHISTFAGISIGNESELNQHWYNLWLFSAFVFGVFVSLFIYNLFLFISTKDILYLYYLLYSIGFYGIVLITQGILPYILGRFDSFDLLILSGPFTKWLEMLSLSLFALKFLELTSSDKKILYGYLMIMASVLIIYLIGFPKVANIMFTLVSCFSIIVLYIGISSYLKGYKPAKYFIIAMGVASIMTAITFLGQVGFVPMSFFNNNISSFALMWDMIFLSLALGYRLKLLQEKNVALENEQKINAKFIMTGELIGSIAHQWRQPLAELSSILMKIKAQSTYGNLSKTELNNFLDEQDKVIKRMSNIIEIFNQTSAKNEKKVFNYQESIIKALKHLENEISQLNIDINIQNSKNIQIQSYENIFIEVLLILLNNSIFALKNNKIEKPKINIRSFFNSSNLTIEIEDNAGGIKMKPIEKIFEPYVSNKSQNGIGLGLYIAQKNIKEQLSGKIEVKNTKNGTCFIITLATQ